MRVIPRRNQYLSRQNFRWNQDPGGHKGHGLASKWGTPQKAIRFPLLLDDAKKACNTGRTHTHTLTATGPALGAERESESCRGGAYRSRGTTVMVADANIVLSFCDASQ